MGAFSSKSDPVVRGVDDRDPTQPLITYIHGTGELCDSLEAHLRSAAGLCTVLDWLATIGAIVWIAVLAAYKESLSKQVITISAFITACFPPLYKLFDWGGKVARCDMLSKALDDVSNATNELRRVLQTVAGPENLNEIEGNAVVNRGKFRVLYARCAYRESRAFGMFRIAFFGFTDPSS